MYICACEFTKEYGCTTMVNISVYDFQVCSLLGTMKNHTCNFGKLLVMLLLENAVAVFTKQVKFVQVMEITVVYKKN